MSVGLGKIIGAIIGGVIVWMGLMFLIHSVWLKPDYDALAFLWRDQADMNHRMWALVIATIFFITGAVLIYVRGVENKPWLGQGFRFGILLAMVGIVMGALSNWMVLPIPHMLTLKTLIGEGIVCILEGLLIAAICQPASARPAGFTAGSSAD